MKKAERHRSAGEIRAAKAQHEGVPSESRPGWFERHGWWAIPFVLFLVMRLFSGDAYYLLGGDQCTFLELGRTFPKHQLWNHELYLIHPPLFGYLLGLLHLALPLLAAGLAATVLCAVANFFALRALGEREGLPRAAVCAGLIYLALNRAAVAYDYHVARVSILVATTALALLAFLKLLNEPGRKTLWWALAANVACMAVSDQALLLLPCEAILLWARGGWRQRRWVPVAAASVAAAAVWPIVRLFEFGRRADLPAGIDGTIEFTRELPVMAAIQPNYLPFTNAHRSLFTQTSLSLANLKPALLADLPTDLLGMPRAISVLIVAGLIAAALIRPERRRPALVWLSLSVLFLLPVGMGMNEWYGMAFIVPFSILIMQGAAAVLDWTAGRVRHADGKLIALLGVACAALAVMWLAAPTPGDHGFLQPRGGTEFLFTRPPLTRGSEVAHFFDSLPRDTGLMASQGLGPEMVYLTDKRVVAIPFDPALLDRFVAEYRVSYIVTSTEYLEPFSMPAADLWTGHLSARYISQHPDRYRLVQRVHEQYPAFYPAADYLVFQVVPVRADSAPENRCRRRPAGWGATARAGPQRTATRARGTSC
jgi:hypothetical protein